MEFFQLLLDQFRKRSLEGEFPYLVPRRGDSINYLVLGMVLGHSLLHGGPGLYCLQSWVYDIIAGLEDYDDLLGQIKITDIPKHAGSNDLLEFINKLDTVETQEQLDDITDQYIQILNFSRWDQTVPVIIANRHLLIGELLMDELVRKRSSQIKSIQDGLDCMGLLSFIKANTSLCRPIFVYSERNKLNPDDIFKLLKTEEDGNNFEKEQALTFFKGLVTDGTERFLAGVLKFVTGLSILPPWGLGSPITIKYLSDDEKHIYPKSMSCFHILYLPTVHSSKERFKDNFETAIAIEGEGFSDNA